MKIPRRQIRRHQCYRQFDKFSRVNSYDNFEGNNI